MSSLPEFDLQCRQKRTYQNIVICFAAFLTMRVCLWAGVCWCLRSNMKTIRHRDVLIELPMTLAAQMKSPVLLR